MNPSKYLALLLVVLLTAALVMAADPPPQRGERGAADSAPIDWNVARGLLQRERSGQRLSADEQAYLDHARTVRAQMQQQPGRGNASARAVPPPATQSTGLIPLDQMSSSDRYKGMDGGLYGSGSNVPPPAHQKAADAELKKIIPLDPSGKPSSQGKIVLISMGMSNTTQEFSTFMQLAASDPQKSPAVVLIDGAMGGADAARWVNPADVVWSNLDNQLRRAGVTADQVQVAWLKQALAGPAQYGPWPAHGQKLADDITVSMNLASKKFPNLRIVYLSSRIYAGYASTMLNPEPYAYEGGFAIRQAIESQMNGDPKLNFDPVKGDVKSPLLLWGPYLWSDGTTPRTSDRLVWFREDLRANDGTHPSDSGRRKVAQLLLNFFKTDPNARGWFTGIASTD